MIEGIYQIGEKVKKSKSLAQISADIPNRKQNINYKIGKIDFLIDKDKIKIDLIEEYSPGKEDDYKFIRLKLTGKQNQFFATFTDLRRFVGDSGKDYAVWLSIEKELKNLKIEDKNLKKDADEFIKILNNIKEKFYENYILNFSKIENFNVEDLSEFKRSINRELGKQEKVIFWSIFINGKKVVDLPFYDLLIKKKLIDDKKKKGKIICSICNKETEEFFDNFARLPIKFFINDKIGFSQKLTDKWEGNFALCEDCYISLFAGEKFILNNFNSKIGRIDYLVIPEILGEFSLNQDRLKEWSEYVKILYNPFTFFTQSELQTKLQEYKEYELIKYFLLNYIFYEQNNQQFKIFTLVKDIPKNRLDILREDFEKYKDNILKNFPKFSEVVLKNYGDIYWIIPLRYSKGDNKILDIPKITNLFSSILDGILINKSFLIHEFWTGLKAKYFKNQSYHNITNSNNTEFETIDYILKTHQLLILLKVINTIDGGKKMDINEIPNKFKQYLQEVGFDEKQTALFLMGTLIGDIGSKQAKYGSKPILNKINFQGMSINRLQILFNEVYEKLEQEKLLFPEQEIIYSIAKELFDKNLLNWDLKPYENVYYLLSGYSYKTKLNIEKAKEKKEEHSNV